MNWLFQSLVNAFLWRLDKVTLDDEGFEHVQGKLV